MFHLMFVHIIFSSVEVLSGHLLGESCSLWFIIRSSCILTICNISYFPFWFWVLIASVSDLCILFTSRTII